MEELEENIHSKIVNLPAGQLERLNQNLPVQGISAYRGTAFITPAVICVL
jgi:hypothetical protein